VGLPRSFALKFFSDQVIHDIWGLSLKKRSEVTRRRLLNLANQIKVGQAARKHYGRPLTILEVPVAAFHNSRAVQTLIVLFSAIRLVHATPDPRLISLVPSGAQLVAGISAASEPGQPGNFLLLTRDNLADFDDFSALVGSDSSRSIHQIVFVKLTGYNVSEHSMLISGRFDQQRILRSAGGAKGLAVYRGIEVAEVQPFEREKGRFSEIRWLATLGESVLLFGSIAQVKQEVDRYLSHVRADERLLLRLSRLRRKDQTWCVLSKSIGSPTLPALQSEIHRALAHINSDLADLALSGEEFEFALSYGRKVELEYSVSGASMGKYESRADLRKQSRDEPVSPTALLTAVNTTVHENTVHDVIAISVPRFNEWLATISRSR